MNTKLNYIKDWPELAQKANWSVSEMAILCHVSVRTLERFFYKELNKTPKMWLKEQRKKQAETLIQSGSSIKEAAAILGYSHAAHFSKEFKKNCGISPSQYSQKRNVNQCRVFA